MRSGSRNSACCGLDRQQLCSARARAGTAGSDAHAKVGSCARSGGTRNGCKKILEDANIKLTETDRLPFAGRAGGPSSVRSSPARPIPTRLAALTRGLKASLPQLVDALSGRVTAHHRFMLRLHLEQIEVIETGLTTLEQHLSEGARPLSRRPGPPEDDAGHQRYGRRGDPRRTRG